ncbi:thiamine phosphate synthase [Leptospira sp. GIMC2001]|uniref:thiamine phosphate synthase n=1 Tax=Leptospira sp. GIMC2001 TaxID=1513297 RepID=UPI00234BE180|nr:thiamine phosphate synthase [Leptospira sp. GIMC2001]WCL50428.1 thiamine phosphate synthase [Leptospira sp. GIMC2001]
MESPRLNFPKQSLYLVTDSSLAPQGRLARIVEESIEGGVQIVQYREKNFQYSTHWLEAKKIHEICQKTKTLFLINDRVDLALALDADGVHLGQSDMPVEIARRILGKDKIIGWSIESLEDLEHALEIHSRVQIDYLGVSPIYSTPTKTDTLGAWNLDGLSLVRARTNIPLVAIGGIKRLNASEVINAGADSLAVISEIITSENPKSVCEDFRNILSMKI